MKTMKYFAVVRALTGHDSTADVSSMDRESVRALVREIAQGRAALAALETEAAERLSQLDCASIAEAAFAKEARLSPSHARTVVQRAETVKAMPLLGSALEDAMLTPEHVDAVARGFRKLDDKKNLLIAHEGRILAQAALLTVPQFVRFMDNLVATLDKQTENDHFGHQRRITQVKMWEDHGSGMIKLSGQFDPEVGSRLWTVLDGAVEKIFHSPAALDCGVGVDPNDHRRALALCHLVEAGADESILCGPSFTGAGASAENFLEESDQVINMAVGNPGSGMQTQVIVTIDLQTLLHGVHPGSVRRNGHGVDLPVDVIRRMACDAGLVPMVLNGDGVVIDVGKAKRLATRRQRRAIFAMHETCAVPHCGVRVKHCVPHHIDWWENGGGTDLHNLVPLCSRHHHKVHEGGWTLTMDESRKVTLVRPPDCNE